MSTEKSSDLPHPVGLTRQERYDLYVVLWHFITQTIKYQNYLLNASDSADLRETDNDIYLAEGLMKRLCNMDYNQHAKVRVRLGGFIPFD